MESKLLRGDQSIVEHTRMQEATLAQQRSQMAEQQRREREIVARMEEAEDSMANLQEGFSSLKQEVEVNTRRLRKLYEKLQVSEYLSTHLSGSNLREIEWSFSVGHEAFSIISVISMVKINVRLNGF
ncbi:hypothetical protein CRM22_011235 [Opisthorchis felineus]|uniref:Uncharacterized protein n=1 Tax=Opisthorchis felineus TaxID=147828 RepID=A0A4S2K1P6_OPIFE|nr:hypothetical protein CRM22_011235 [Opisthorchis felineus]